MPIILVADDNSNIQKMVSLAFKERGIEVVAVGNGEAAVRRIPEVRPDVVLADVFMPVRSGYEVCEFVKKDARFAQIPVVLLVGAFDPLDEKEARRVGADGVLKKPFVPPDPLVAMINSFLDKSAKPAPAAASATAEQPAAPPPQEPTPMPAPDLSVEPEPELEQFATARGPLSLREEDGSPALEGLLGAAGTPSETANPWDEPESEWQRRRAQMEYDIPGSGAHGASDSHSDAPPTTFPGADVQAPDDFVTEQPRLSVEPGTLADLAANPIEWMEMMSPPPAEQSKPAAPWQISTHSPEGSQVEDQGSQSAPTDATSSEQFGDWQKEPPASEARPDAAASPAGGEPIVGEHAEAPHEIPPETLPPAPPTPPMWPASFEAEYGISAETVLEPESAEAWTPAASEEPTAGAIGGFVPGQLTPDVAGAGDNPPGESPIPIAPAEESPSKPEYELLVAPAAVIPFRPTADSTHPAPPTESPIAPTDLETNFTPEAPGASSSYASYLPSDASSDVVHTSEEKDKAAPAPLSAAVPEPSPAPGSLDPAVVEAVVAKVLDRLRPELQELLSEKLVRRLVESALEHEVSKK